MKEFLFPICSLHYFYHITTTLLLLTCCVIIFGTSYNYDPYFFINNHLNQHGKRTAMLPIILQPPTTTHPHSTSPQIYDSSPQAQSGFCTYYRWIQRRQGEIAGTSALPYELQIHNQKATGKRIARHYSPGLTLWNRGQICDEVDSQRQNRGA